MYLTIQKDNPIKKMIKIGTDTLKYINSQKRKRFSISLLIRNVQIKTSKYHYLPTTKLKRVTIPSIGRDV